MKSDETEFPRRSAVPSDPRRRRRPGLLIALGAAALFALTGCGEDALAPGGGDQDPPRQPAGSLDFVELSDTAPPFFQFDGDTSFVATAGEDAELEIYFQDPDDPDQRGDKFLDFEIDGESLLEFPDGTPFQPGDAVTITVSVARDTLLVDFGPDGLRFDPDEPAELNISFREADDDFDDDGEDDPELEDDLDLWRQEQPGEDWFRDGDRFDLDRDEIEADIESFTRWAVAI